MTPKESLYRLLLSLFDTQHLFAFVRMGPDGEQIAAHLPTLPCKLAELCHEAVSTLDRYGHVNAQLFHRLRQEFPQRCVDIERAAERWASPKKTVVIEFDEDIRAFTPDVLDRLLNMLRLLANDPDLGIRRIRAGSIFLDLEVSEMGSHLLTGRDVAEMTRMLGYRVVTIRDASASLWSTTSAPNQVYQNQPILGRRPQLPSRNKQALAAALDGLESDTSLCERWSAGDPTAGDKLMERYHTTLQDFLRRKVDDENIIDEITQIVWLEVVKIRSELKSTKSFSGRLNMLATHQLRRWYEARLPINTIDFETMSICEAEGALYGSKPRKTATHPIIQALRELPFGEQLTLELFTWEDLSIEQIAEILCVNAATVRHRLRRGRQALHETVNRFLQLPEISPQIRELIAWYRHLEDVASAQTR